MVIILLLVFSNLSNPDRFKVIVIIGQANKGPAWNYHMEEHVCGALKFVRIIL